MCVCVQDLCIRQAQVLNTKSSLVEEAANELINMLLEFDHSQRDEEEKVEVESSAESKTIDHNDSEGMFTFSSRPPAEEDMMLTVCLSSYLS